MSSSWQPQHFQPRAPLTGQFLIYITHQPYFCPGTSFCRASLAELGCLPSSLAWGDLSPKTFMPAKKKISANANDGRNGPDGGLTAPGKKVTKQRSNTTLNGLAHTNGRNPGLLRTAPPDTLRLPAPVVADEDEYSQSQSLAHSSRSSWQGGVHNNAQEFHAGQTMEKDPDTAVDKANNPSHFGINAHTATDELNGGHTPGESVATVIQSHCRLDMLAMLFVLLELPLFVQLAVQLAFVWMTIGNPTASWTHVSLPTSLDWSRSHGGNPSAMVSIVANSIFFCIWVLLPFGKDFILELAPAVIAISLSGGSSGRDAWKYASLCVLSVLTHDVIMDSHRRQRLLNVLWLCLSKLSFSPIPLPHAASFMPTLPQATWHWWDYTLIACEIHIVTHGCIRLVRRWVDSQSSRKPGTRPDSDSVSLLIPPTILPPPDNSSEGQHIGSSDCRPPGPSPAAQKTLSSGKKRKKQANFVRSQQPLWAAIANTRINHPGESELNQTRETRCEGGSSGDRSLGDELYHHLDESAWVTEVKDTELSFEAELTLEDGDSWQHQADGDALPSKPFEVRVNDMDWPSIVFTNVESLSPRKWLVQGKVLDLTPSLSYLIQLVRPADRSIVYSTALSTSSETSLDFQPDLSPQDAIRPPSPVTTLKKAIARDEAKLNDQKQRGKKAQKSRMHAIRNFKQDVENLKRSLETTSSDERQRSRRLQFQNTIAQHEQTTKALTNELVGLGEIPQADLDAFNESRKRHGDAQRQLARLKRDAEEAKAMASKEEDNAHAETAKINGKREKADGRLASLNERHKTTTEDIEAKRNARAANHDMLLSHIAMQQSQIAQGSQHLANYAAVQQDLEAKITDLQRGSTAYDGGYMAGYGQFAPHTPESSYSSVNTRAPHGLGFQNNAMGTPTLHSRQNSLRHPRNRSSSMLSAVSGFTANSHEDIPADAIVDFYHPSRNGSGSSGSHRASPGPKLSPIGTEVGRGSPRQKR